MRSWSPEPGEKLFDLERDPAELHDLSADRPEIAAELRAALDAHMIGMARGYSIVLRNEGDELVQGLILIATEHEPVAHGVFLFAEEGAADHRRQDVDGPLQWELMVENGRSHYLTRLQVRTAPGDDDGLAFELDPAETSISVMVLVDGAQVDVASVFLGAEGRQPQEMPFELDLTRDDELLATGLEALAERRGSGQSVFLWKSVGARTPRANLPEDLLRNLEALGYVEDD